MRGGGIWEEEKAFLVPREKEVLSEAVAQLGVCNPEVTHFKWSLCVSLPWGTLGFKRLLSALFGPACSILYPHPHAGKSWLSSILLFLELWDLFCSLQPQRHPHTHTSPAFFFQEG